MNAHVQDPKGPGTARAPGARQGRGPGALTSPLVALVSPAVGSSARVGDTALAGLRILAGLLWLYNVSWKLPPDFGREAGRGLYRFTGYAVEHPVFPPYSWVVEHVVLTHFTAFGWGVLAAETLLAVLLLTGTVVRVAALLGLGQSLAIALSVVAAPHEWPWSYWMMIGIHALLLLTASGRVAALDGVRSAPSRAGGRLGLTPAARLLLGWGSVMGLAGVSAMALAAGDGPLAPRGAALGGSFLSVSLGSYNVLGAAALLVVGASMLAAVVLRRSALALLAAAVAVLAALSLYAQLGRTDAWLGGTNTSAAFFLCAAVVGAATASSLRASSNGPEELPHGRS